MTLPRTLYRRFRLHALEQDLTVSALITRMIRAELDEMGAEVEAFGGPPD
ncbi:MAG: hypothetical protein WCL59_10460 [Cyanobium sp. ELA507]